MHHDFSDTERWAAVFDDPDRDGWQKPRAVVALLGLKAGQRVADLGAGTGYFLPYLSTAVGADGEVLGLDVEPAMVDHMVERIAREELSNAGARRIPYDDPGLEPHSVDRVLIVNTWHHIDHREDYAAKLRRALRPGGAIFVVDFTRDSPVGPPVKHRLPPEQVRKELEQGGLHSEQIDSDLTRQYVVRAWDDATPFK